MSFRLPHAVAALALVGLAAPVSAQNADRMKANFERKLDSEFMKKVDWITDYDAARAKAAKSGEVIFAYFTRSYAP